MIKERQFGVSADSSGLLGTPETWRKVYGFLEKERNFAGIEAVGWLWINGILQKAKLLKFPVTGIHGRMSGGDNLQNPIHKARVMILDSLLVETKQLLSKYPETKYVLIHSSEASKKTREIKNLNRPPAQTLFIENDLSPNSFCKSIDITTRLIKRGKVGNMFDLGHLLFELDGNMILERDWPKVVRTIDSALNVADSLGDHLSSGIHLPLGPKSLDSIPPSEMTNNMWSDLRILLEYHPKTLLIIENQQTGINPFFLSKLEAGKQRVENEEKFELLIKHGIVQG